MGRERPFLPIYPQHSCCWLHGQHTRQQNKLKEEKRLQVHRCVIASTCWEQQHSLLAWQVHYPRVEGIRDAHMVSACILPVVGLSKRSNLQGFYKKIHMKLMTKQKVLLLYIWDYYRFFWDLRLKPTVFPIVPYQLTENSVRRLDLKISPSVKSLMSVMVYISTTAIFD